MTNINEFVPDNWCETRFTDVLDIQGGTQPPKSEFIDHPESGYIRLLQIRDFGQKPVPTYIPETNKLKKCFKNDLLIGRYGASLGRICTGMDGAYNVALAKVVHSPKINTKYLRRYLESEMFQAPLRLLSRSAQNGFNKEDLTAFSFYILPEAEQNILAEKIDALLLQVDSIKTRLDRVPAILKRFRQAVLSAAVNGFLTYDWRLKNETLLDDWRLTRIGELAQVATGKTPKRTDLKYWEHGSIPWLTSACTGLPFINHAEQFVTEVAVKECSLKLFEPGTLLLAMYGEGKTRGQVTELKIRAACNQACAAIIVDQDNILLNFMKISFMENYETTRKVAAGGAQPNLNLNKVREITLMLPPLKEQAEIVARVEKLFAWADNIEKQLAEAQKRVDNLTQSILAKAFRGELTEQWRRDNPELISGENSAAALLERIKAERQAAAPKRKTKAKKQEA